MGRALLIISAGLLITFALVQGAMKGRQLSFSERSGAYIVNSQARNVANTGIELTLRRILDEETNGNPGWTNNGNWYEIPIENEPFENGTARVLIERLSPVTEDDSLRLTAAGNFTLNNEVISDTVRVIVVEDYYLLPGTKGAVVYDGPSATPNYNGTAFAHDGRDHDLNGNVLTDAEPVAGVVAKTDAVKTSLETSLTSGQLDKIQGDPPIEVDDNPDDNFNDLVTMYSAAADTANVISGCPCTFNNATYGTPSAPQITVVQGDLTLKGGTSGAGILVVKDGGQLITRGDFTFYGLILVQGAAADMETSLNFAGNTNIYGGMMLGSVDSNADLNLTIKGNIHLNFSSQARGLAQRAARDNINGKKTFKTVSIYE